MSESRTLTRLQMRLLSLGLFMSFAVVAVSGRLFYLMVTMRESLRERGELQHQHTLKLDPRRGTIRDRHGRPLATSVEVESVYAVPKSFSKTRAFASAKKLAACLEMPEPKIAARLGSDKSFAWLERKAKPRVVRCVRALDVTGVHFLPESRRYYPKRQLAAQVLGYVGIDNEGMGGVEYALEDTIRGEPGRRIIWSDARNRRAASRIDERPRSGRSVYLTIDENLQFIAEAELADAVRQTGAKNGIAIVIRPGTGELLAMASFPGFNPNRFGDFPASSWRNRSVTDVYEPGSTFKIVGAAAALQEGVTAEDERIDCGRGKIQVGESVIRDSHDFDVLTFREVFEKSSNVGMIRIGQRLGKERLEHYIHAFGFGEASGVELPAESRGLLRPASRWGPVTLASISFGQEIGVTPLQMVSAANVIASSGYLMRPRLVLGFGGPKGRLETNFSPEPVRRVIDEETAKRVTALLVGVVERGTGRRARIAGYQVAGKTGTAQKAVRGGYSKNDYVASFVGFAPAARPELTALVILDSPDGDHSGARAAAVFARIMERSLQYLGVPRRDEPKLRVAQVWPQMKPIMGTAGSAGQASRRNVHASLGAEPEGVPDVSGLPARDALARFVARGIVPELTGSGVVVGQWPSGGQPLAPGARARLFLGAAPATPEGGPELMPELASERGVFVAALESGGSRLERAFKWLGPTE